MCSQMLRSNTSLSHPVEFVGSPALSAPCCSGELSPLLPSHSHRSEFQTSEDPSCCFLAVCPACEGGYWGCSQVARLCLTTHCSITHVGAFCERHLKLLGLGVGTPSSLGKPGFNYL